jgi:hypothetical protein
VAKWEQESAQAIADALHAVEAAERDLSKAIKRLHRVMHEKAKEHSEALGIDVAPLSGGLEKPPQEP